MSTRIFIKYGKPFVYVYKQISSVVVQWFWGDGDNDDEWGDY